VGEVGADSLRKGGILCDVTWEYQPVDIEEIRREFAAKVEQRQIEIRGRLERIERRWEEAEEGRRREWEQLEGRLMTAAEESKHFYDGLLRKNSVMTNEYIAILWEGREEARIAAEEQRAELRANTEAVLKMLDRLPPQQAE
jgi:hypothetical protein